MAQLTVKLHVAWWIKPYFYMLALICAFTGREPNYERVQYWITKAIKVERGPAWRRLWRKAVRVISTPARLWHERR